jgi:hypothetical protein
MADSIEAAKSLHVNVKELTGTIALVPARRWGRFDAAEATKPMAPANPSDRRDAHFSAGGDSLECHFFTSQTDDEFRGAV